MTANERLAAAGLFDAYDKAIKSGDLNAINQVLRQVGLRQVGLRQDEDGMNGQVANDA